MTMTFLGQLRKATQSTNPLGTWNFNLGSSIMLDSALQPEKYIVGDNQLSVHTSPPLIVARDPRCHSKQST